MIQPKILGFDPFSQRVVIIFLWSGVVIVYLSTKTLRIS